MATVISYVSEHSDRQYSMTLKNESSTPWIFYVYQQQSNPSTNIFSLAWFVSPFMIVPGAQIKFVWTTDYNIVWDQTGPITPGIVFSAGETISADPAGANTSTFSVSPGPNLSPATAGAPQGSLKVISAPDVPANSFSVGIGMGSAPTFVTATGPNLTHLFTISNPSYWIAAEAADIQTGTVLVTNIVGSLNVKFPVNVYDVTCVLDSANVWHQI